MGHTRGSFKLTLKPTLGNFVLNGLSSHVPRSTVVEGGGAGPGRAGLRPHGFGRGAIRRKEAEEPF